jgi:putative FmdB family regulatory protein
MRYEYECPEDGKTIEVQHLMREEPEITCPDCSKPMRKVFSRNGAVFKGFGWACTDYAEDR